MDECYDSISDENERVKVKVRVMRYYERIHTSNTYSAKTANTECQRLENMCQSVRIDAHANPKEKYR
jgi:hypothetical protein